jgi:hypothetical protein
MSSENASNHQWITTEQSYTLEYELLQSVNPYFEEYPLVEYGIRCKLFDNEHHLLSEENVKHITPNENVIKELVQKLVLNKVFPVHLLDVVSDELVKDLDFSY